TWPPRAAERHCSIADITLSWPRLRCPALACARRRRGDERPPRLPASGGSPPQEEADRLGLRTKCSTTANGTERGGKTFSRGHLYTLLSNPIYTGQIAHKREYHPGQQPALIDDESWSAVRDQLAANTRDHRRRTKAAEPSLLVGLLVDARGERLTPAHAINTGQ